MSIPAVTAILVTMVLLAAVIVLRRARGLQVEIGSAEGSHLIQTLTGVMAFFTLHQLVAAVNAIAVAAGITAGSENQNIRSSIFAIQEGVLIVGAVWAWRRLR